ncbi:zinc ribbon-containing protein [Rhizobium leguminosarum]|uniref:zinc ribbon-containing protein n=1 Tax=Rhizobium leguminosarum TaxID=384 RepID=UPI00140FAB32|nr:zinc ribbon-containing protein [Rhizobium leguminosarum]QIO64789.1 zinc ribbon-containing protein [Rhizobium leguminosarum bv. trifolii]
MAYYKYLNYFQQLNHVNFDTERTPGYISGDSGIYRCVHCGDEIAVNKNNPLPPQNHHQHNPPAPIRWKLVAVAVQR